MTAEYQICFVMPPGYKGSLVFREVIFLLRNSLASLGYNCVIKPNALDEKKINIVVGYHLLQYGDYLKDYRYIPFQLEQLDSGNPWYNEQVEKLLRYSEDVWDFSEINQRFLKEKGIDSRYVTMGYHPDLKIIPDNREKDIDVLFYGSINERRKSLLEELSTRVKLKVLSGAFGAERDEVISRSKIILNMHYYPTRILESVRISYLLNNNAFVISEDADDNPYEKVDLVTAPYDQLTDTCEEYVSSPTLLEQNRTVTYEQFREHYSMVDILKKVLPKE